MRLALDEPKESDSAFENGTIKYVIDNDLASKTGAITIDYVEAGYQSGFSINSVNPVGGGACSAGGGCSC